MAKSTDIIFKMGVSGAKGVVDDFTRMTAKLSIMVDVAVAVGKAVAEAVSEAQKFGQVVRSMSIDMSKFDSATKGLIDTTKSYQQANMFSAAGVEATAGQMRAAGVAAIEYARATGGDATEAFVTLTNAIKSGAKEGLQKFGVQVSENTNKIASATDALKQLEKQFGKTNIELQTTEEALSAISNSLGTTKNLLVDSAWKNFTDTIGATAGGLAGMTLGMDQLNAAIIESDGLIGDWLMSVEGMKNTAYGTALELMYQLTGSENVKNKLDKQAQIAYLEMEIRKAQGAKRKKSRAEAAAARAGDLYGLAETNKKKSGGSRAVRRSDMEFTTDETEMVTRLEADAAAGASRSISGGGRGDFYSGQAVFGPQGQYTEEMTSAAMQRQMDFADAQFVTAEQAEKDKLEMLDWYGRQNYENQKRWAEMENAARIAETASAINAVGGMFGQAASLMDKNSKSGFERSKNLQMAQVAMNTPSAAIAAYQSMAGIPYIGPALGIAAAAAATSFGIAQMAKIKNTKFNGKTSAASVSASSASLPSAGNYGAGNSGAGGSNIVINSVLDGEIIRSSMIRANDIAAQRGDKAFTVQG